MQAVPDVVLVEDDDDYREVLAADLADRGFAVSCFADGPSFLEALSNGTTTQVAPQVVVLDWSLPQMSGFEVLGALRERGVAVPVVFLTGRAMVERELQALGHGAVDFVDKARGVDVLAHRLRVIIGAQRPQRPAEAPAMEHHGDLALLPVTERALWRQHDVGLTVTEYRIVALLVSHKGEVQTYRTIYDVAHYAGFAAGAGEEGFRTNVRSLLKRIRRKFVASDPDFAEIENAQGLGYRWRQRDG
jgi:two-component system response regulator ChvI